MRILLLDGSELGIGLGRRVARLDGDLVADATPFVGGLVGDVAARLGYLVTGVTRRLGDFVRLLARRRVAGAIAGERLFAIALATRLVGLAGIGICAGNTTAASRARTSLGEVFITFLDMSWMNDRASMDVRARRSVERESVPARGRTAEPPGRHRPVLASELPYPAGGEHP